MELHLCALLTNGDVWHTIRRADAAGTWFPFSHVTESVIGDNPGSTNPSPLKEIACALVGGELHLCCISVNGNLWHTIRRQIGSWYPYGNVRPEASFNPIGDFTTVAAAGVLGVLNVLTITYAGETASGLSASPQLALTIRYPNAWTPRELVGPPFEKIACANVGGQLHACGLTWDKAGVQVRELFHAIRGPSRWNWGDVRGTVLFENPGSAQPGPKFEHVSCGGPGNELHVCAQYGGVIWHTVRRPDGHWTAFGNVNTQVLAENPGTFDPGTGFGDVACTEVGPDLHVCGVMEATGGIKHTIRRAAGGWLEFGDVFGQTGRPPSPVRKIAVAGIG